MTQVKPELFYAFQFAYLQIPYANTCIINVHF